MKHKTNQCSRKKFQVNQSLTNSDIKIRFCVEARVHLQLLLRFLVRFSPFHGCERVNQTRILR